MPKKPDAKNTPESASRELSDQDLERVAGGRYLKIHMNNIYVTSYQTSGSSGDTVPTDTPSLNFAKPCPSP